MKKIYLTVSEAARRRAISLIEGVLYLVIALAVIVGGIVFFQQSQMSSNITDTARAMSGIAAQTRSLYQNQRTFDADLITPSLIKAGAVPSTFVGGTEGAADGTIRHPFNGEISVYGNGPDRFVITLSSLPQEACLRMGVVGPDGSGPLGTGILAMIANEDSTALVYDGDLTDEPGYMEPPFAPEDMADICDDDWDLSVYYAR